jgi:phosphoglycolate phosphatase-like HAD superfamily hydrolase
VPIQAKWVGIDFGMCLCDSSPERTYWMIGDCCKELGRPELIDICCHKWRILKERYGSWSALKEGHRDEIVSYVFDGHPHSAATFSKMEQKYLKVADGAVDAINYLRDQSIEISIAAELKRTLGPIGTDQVSLFLKNQKVIDLFAELITPQGKVNLRDGSVDLRYKGLSKETGTLYDLLVEDLERRGIQPAEAVMVGDKEWSDITPAQKRGFKAIQYTGFLFLAPSPADYTIRHFSELKNLITGVKA